jgi:DNA-binding CsgD family transcriptional regulator
LNNIGEINTNAVFGDKSELVVVRDAVQAIANQTLKRRFEKQIAKESEEFGIGFSLAIRRFHDDYTDLFMLMAKEGDYLAPSKLLSSLESLQHAIEYYYDHAGLLLSQSAKHRVNYSAVKEKILSNSVVADVDAFKKSCPLSKVKIDICGREAVLSEKDLAYSQLLLQGYTQRQIAQELCLSARTIESRTESLKNRLDCYSMSQLRLTLRTALLSGGRVG